jgi:hypothetical protein
MRRRTLGIAGTSLGLLAAAWLSAAALVPATSDAVPVDYSFHEAPLNSLGVRSMAELRGKPVVIDFWGKN